MSVHWNGKYLGACTQSLRLFIFIIIVIYAYICYNAELEYSTVFWLLVQVFCVCTCFNFIL